MRLNLVGGFLGSGKTTAIANASRLLMEDHKIVAVIANDQGEQQVDGMVFKGLGVPDMEVANGCFCCNYDQLEEYVLAIEASHHAEVIFAESVGTCTDLVATVLKPLNLRMPNLLVVISVFADAAFLASIIEGTSLFIEDDVRYLYRKQLEEADLLIINKKDLVSPEQLGEIAKVITAEYPGKELLFQNSLDRGDVTQWLEATTRFQPTVRRSLELDYVAYGAGEARLAWLDKRLHIRDDQGNAVLIAGKIIAGIFRRVQEQELLIGHLKFFVETKEWTRKISFTHSTTDFHLLPDDREVKSLSILINARVQADPDLLARVVDEVIKHASYEQCTIVTEKWSAFKPGYPRPKYRIGNHD
jgi:G3E family GTPase